MTCELRPQILAQLKDVWLRQHANSCAVGPAATVLKAAASLQWPWNGFDNLITFQPAEFPQLDDMLSRVFSAPLASRAFWLCRFPLCPSTLV